MFSALTEGLESVASGAALLTLDRCRKNQCICAGARNTLMATSVLEGSIQAMLGVLWQVAHLCGGR